MNTISITPEQLWSTSEGYNLFIPVVINETKWVLKFDNSADCISKPSHFLETLKFAINVNMGELKHVEGHLGMNGYSNLNLAGAMHANEFVNNLHPETELDKALYS